MIEPSQFRAVPVFDETHAVLECVCTATFDGGDHTIVVGRVEHLDIDERAEPLVYYRGGFAAVERPACLAT